MCKNIALLKFKLARSFSALLCLADKTASQSSFSVETALNRLLQYRMKEKKCFEGASPFWSK